jgi:hypothetical protein
METVDLNLLDHTNLKLPLKITIVCVTWTEILETESLIPTATLFETI